MSHEIRTPMNAILGMTRLTLETDLSSQQRYYLNTVLNSSEMLLNIVNDILDFSKVEAGKLDLDERLFDLWYLLDSTIRMMRDKAQNKGLEIILDQCQEQNPQQVFGDDLRLRQVLVNLIDNAIKFTEQGKVIISCEAMEKSAESVLFRFTVKDTGVGIAKDSQAFIFDSFKQADSGISRAYGGTGLGLAISKRLTVLMGGEIWLESEVESGTSFYFTARLGVGVGPAKQLPSEKKPQVQTVSCKILIVDDVTTNRDLVRILLENNGHQVVEAESGYAALQRLTEMRFDMMLLDIHMPEFDGFQVIQLIRSLEKGLVPDGHNLSKTLIEKITTKLKGGHLPVVAMTAHALKEDKEKCYKAGMDGYLSKPFRPDEIDLVVMRATADKKA